MTDLARETALEGLYAYLGALTGEWTVLIYQYSRLTNKPSRVLWPTGREERAAVFGLLRALLTSRPYGGEVRVLASSRPRGRATVIQWPPAADLFAGPELPAEGRPRLVERTATGELGDARVTGKKETW